MSQLPMVMINENLFANYLLGITRVHRVTPAEKQAANDPNFREAEVGDVVIKFSDGGGVRIKPEEGGNDFMAYLKGVSDSLVRRQEAAEANRQSTEDNANRSFADRF
jgi:hypothetical protein